MRLPPANGSPSQLGISDFLPGTHLRTMRKEWYQLLPDEQESFKSDIHVHMQAEAGTN